MELQAPRAPGTTIDARLGVIVVGATGVALCSLAWTATFWFRYHPHLPWQDLYVLWTNLLPLLETGELDRNTLATLLEPHYASHRIFLPRLLVVLDVVQFHGQGHALYASGWGSLFALWAMFARTAARLGNGDRAGTMFGAALGGILLFAPPGAWNLANPINSSWHLGLALALGSFLVALTGFKRSNALALPAAYVLATLAALTNFAGVIAWLLLPLIAVPAGWRTVSFASVASGLLTALYLQGVSSDAAIAMRWEYGDPQSAAALRSMASEALAGNGLASVASKTLRFLGWPLAQSAPLPAALLVMASFLVVLASAFRWLRGWRRRSDAAPWLMFAIACAGLCIGTAIATQLGRVIEQPNYAHGPSFERYQTVVGVYWSACAALTLMFARELRALPRSLAWGACLMVAILIGAPGSACLKQEVQSAEYASRLFLLGEHPGWREPQDGALLRFQPEFVFTFDAFMARRELAYHSPIPIIRRTTGSPQCSEMGLYVLVDGDGPGGSVRLTAQWPAWQSLWTRGLVLYVDSRPVGRMNPHHTGGYTPADLMSPTLTRWEGMADAKMIHNARWEIGVETPLGMRSLCTPGMAEREHAG
jgi:hypothetical protein